jgi:hypothetical protein
VIAPGAELATRTRIASLATGAVLLVASLATGILLLQPTGRTQPPSPATTTDTAPTKPLTDEASGATVAVPAGWVGLALPGSDQPSRRARLADAVDDPAQLERGASLADIAAAVDAALIVVNAGPGADAAVIVSALPVDGAGQEAVVAAAQTIVDAQRSTNVEVTFVSLPMGPTVRSDYDLSLGTPEAPREVRARSYAVRAGASAWIVAAYTDDLARDVGDIEALARSFQVLR